MIWRVKAIEQYEHMYSTSTLVHTNEFLLKLVYAHQRPVGNNNNNNKNKSENSNENEKTRLAFLISYESTVRRPMYLFYIGHYTCGMRHARVLFTLYTQYKQIFFHLKS